LKNHGADQEVDDMFDVGVETLALPLEERMKFEQGDNGQSFGSVIDMAYKRKLNNVLTDTRKWALRRSMERVRTSRPDH
jgi:hypothetical protein